MTCDSQYSYCEKALAQRKPKKRFAINQRESTAHIDELSVTKNTRSATSQHKDYKNMVKRKLCTAYLQYNSCPAPTTTRDATSIEPAKM